VRRAMRNGVGWCAAADCADERWERHAVGQFRRAREIDALLGHDRREPWTGWSFRIGHGFNPHQPRAVDVWRDEECARTIDPFALKTASGCADESGRDNTHRRDPCDGTDGGWGKRHVGAVMTGYTGAIVKSIWC